MLISWFFWFSIFWFFLFTYFNSIFLVIGATGESMLPNFQKDYEIIGNNFYVKNEIEYGDVIIVEGHNKTNGVGLVKRVIGLPGDKIKIQNGKIILNGKVLKQKNDGKFRFNGKTLNILLMKDISLKNKIRFLFHSNKLLYSIRINFFNFFSGWGD